ncbi:type VI secretion system tip protein VgrG [Solitalea canadensis]|uniref:Rhs element Vgr protein n=1 Tax=Solitalea canadensis (strain ATCC 29591 / DSM 3403 / JCM 21819 / LMG 8368 / NBRC 15130 / NCIMB 12057 / USAM 9D) TaxID=929556 RepID=H8KU94_SOLCM|nr:type VI secretion system tip protein VgrG [Solitalea canadensis]AFD07206.1 Rhs element Vgr protein [Solitalea canadensis DSM 3403]
MASTDNTVLVEDKMDVVTLLIKVDGEEISRQYHVTSLTILQEINKIPTANLVVIDGEASKQDFSISSTGQFVPGKKIEIELGYFRNGQSDDDKFLFTGIIVTNTHKINNNCCELTIECKDETIKMTVNKSNAHFKKKITASEIAEELLNKNNISTEKVASIDLKHEQLVQSNISDWDFMIGRIDVAGMICVISSAGVKIKQLAIQNPPTNESGEMLKLIHGKNILEFSADKDSRIRSDEVKTLCWDFKEQKVRVSGNDEKIVEEKEDQSKNVSKGFEMRSAAFFTEEEQTVLAKTKKIKQDLSGIKGKVKYIARTDITVLPGDFIELSGVGNAFEGFHFVSAVQQEYTDGCWITEATLGWNEQFFSEQTNPQHSASTTGQPSTVQGLQIGIVTNIEDSDGEYRVQVKLPVVDDKAEGLHARVATLDAGNKRGTFFRPEIDDEVIVGFINDDPSNPVILGMLHSSAKSSPLEPKKNNNEKGYVSRSEIKLLFDDDKKSVIIQTPGSRSFEMNDDSGTITLKDGNGNKIVMGSSGITIEASKEIKIKAGTSLSLEAKKISIKSDTSLEAQGSASVKISGGGATEIKGGVVKIN